MNEDKWNSYFYENENILKNNLNIHDYETLKKREYEIVSKKNVLLYLSNYKGDFDIEHLKYIHKFLFEDIYPFAGEFRIVNMGKDDRASFIDYKDIEKYLNELLSNIDNLLINKANSKFLYAEALANMYYYLLEIHPFREGNGRTVREFLREYVEAKNISNDYIYELDFNLNKEDKKLLDKATKSDTRGELILMFNKMLKRKDKQIKNIK